MSRITAFWEMKFRQVNIIYRGFDMDASIGAKTLDFS
jgi:hypothetical protein